MGRVGEMRGDTLTLVVRDDRAGDWTVRAVPLDEIVKAIVQVEFSPPAKRELELATFDRSAGTGART
jgi:ribosome maturation factor RimP